MNSVTKKRRTTKSRAEKPVSAEILRAAERSKLMCDTARVEAQKVLNEVKALRKVADAVELVFQHDGIGDPAPIDILREAIRCAQDDFEILGDSAQSELGVPHHMVFSRAQRRLDLALALADYRERFGRFDVQAVTS